VKEGPKYLQRFLSRQKKEDLTHHAAGQLQRAAGKDEEKEVPICPRFQYDLPQSNG